MSNVVEEWEMVVTRQFMEKKVHTAKSMRKCTISVVIRTKWPLAATDLQVLVVSCKKITKKWTMSPSWARAL